MDWKNILALAVFVIPIVHCTSVEQRTKAEIQIACIQSGKAWTPAGGGQCNPQDN